MNRAYFQNFLAIVFALIATILLPQSLHAKQKSAKPECPNLESFSKEMFDGKSFWEVTQNLSIQGPEITRNFEKHTVKKFFHNRELVKADLSQEVLRYRQEGCDKLVEVHPDGTEVFYKISNKKPGQMKLVTQNASLEGSDGFGTKMHEQYIKIKHQSGQKVIEKISLFEFSVKNKCKKSQENETHLVEVKSLIAWKKPLAYQHTVSEKLIRFMSRILTEVSQNKKFNECEYVSTMRGISSGSQNISY